MKRNLKILLCLTVIIYSAIISQGLNFSIYVYDVCAADYVKADAADNEYVVFTEKNIKTEDMRKKSKLNKQKLSEYMKKFPKLSGIEETLIEMQDEHSVNALLILAIVRLESGNGKSQIAQSRNNLGGIVVSGKTVNVYKSFDTRSDCIIYMAELISKNYLTEGGKYFNGYTLTDIAKKYSASPDIWAERIKEIIYEIQTGIDEIDGIDKIDEIDEVQAKS